MESPPRGGETVDDLASARTARAVNSVTDRAVTVRALRDRNAELLGLYSRMNASMDQLCDRYGETDLELLADFLRRTTDAGRGATDELAGN